MIPRYIQDFKKAYDLLDLDILYFNTRETGLKVSIHMFDFWAM